MNPPKHQISVAVGGQEYLVEVQDLNTDPVIAKIGEQIFEVSVKDAPPLEPVEDAAAKPVSVRKPVQTISKPKKTPALAQSDAGGNTVVAPLPGNLVGIFVKPGDSVSVGQELCSLEAMKMKNAIRSPRDGVVASVPVTLGQAVSYGEALVTFE